jgi:hypothetical protein
MKYQKKNLDLGKSTCENCLLKPTIWNSMKPANLENCLIGFFF